jgi:hypothetical protein
MQLNRENAISLVSAERGISSTVQEQQPVTLDYEIVERGAQALFEFVFSGTERLDGKHLWATCDNEIKAGFRAEARAVLEAIWIQIGSNYSS